DRAATDLDSLDDELNGAEPPAWVEYTRPEELQLVRNTLRAVLALQRVHEGELGALEDAWAMRDMGPIGRIVLAEAQAKLGLDEDATATFSATLQQQRLSLWSAWA